jgi:hypothetical protein
MGEDAAAARQGGSGMAWSCFATSSLADPGARPAGSSVPPGGWPRSDHDDRPRGRGRPRQGPPARPRRPPPSVPPRPASRAPRRVPRPPAGCATQRLPPTGLDPKGCGIDPLVHGRGHGHHAGPEPRRLGPARDPTRQAGRRSPRSPVVMPLPPAASRLPLGDQPRQHAVQQVEAEVQILGCRVLLRRMADAADAGHGHHDRGAEPRQRHGVVGGDGIEPHPRLAQLVRHRVGQILKPRREPARRAQLVADERPARPGPRRRPPRSIAHGPRSSAASTPASAERSSTKIVTSRARRWASWADLERPTDVCSAPSGWSSTSRRTPVIVSAAATSASRRMAMGVGPVCAG